MKPIILICGPTASGKTKKALELAQNTNAEIISADSGQIYKELDIGTDKPTKEERNQVPHHLVDILNPNETFSAALFAEKAGQAIEEIRSHQKNVLIVGGTGLYIQALLEGLFQGPPRNEELRQELEKKETPLLYEELLKVDPEGMRHKGNRQRIIRALEVFELTGEPISRLQKEQRKEKFPYPIQKIGLTLEREALYERINQRVQKMFETGWVQEVEEIIKKWGDSIPALNLIGYREISEHLKGKRDLDKTVQLVQQKTRNYAKRQLTWFRGDKEINWISTFTG
ncbi:MAG: tRNA (adenosine(37)-N6)-dimethylallyltransferase MiaA [bacterium]|nr:tRNA (adenosine(37)-N6)-dimethylallyltransferase MiaA [bacterium]